MNSGKTRSSLFAVVGAYLLYIVWQLFEGWNDPDTTMSHAVMVLFMALFVIAAVFLFIFAFKLWKNADREEAEQKRAEDDATRLK